MKRTLAYLFVVLVATYGAFRAEQAQDRSASALVTARAVDLNGDRSLCESENRIRAKSNVRDAALENTAKLVKEALHVLSQADDPGTNVKLRAIAKRARKIRTEFKPEKLSDCEKRFPREAE